MIDIETARKVCDAATRDLKPPLRTMPSLDTGHCLRCSDDSIAPLGPCTFEVAEFIRLAITALPDALGEIESLRQRLEAIGAILTEEAIADMRARWSIRKANQLRELLRGKGDTP